MWLGTFLGKGIAVKPAHVVTSIQGNLPLTANFLLPLEPQSFDVPGVSIYTAASNMVRNRFSFSDTPWHLETVLYNVKKHWIFLSLGTLIFVCDVSVLPTVQLIPRHDIFCVYKLFLLDIWKQFYIMSESIEVSLTRYPGFRLRRVCLYRRSIFCVIKGNTFASSCFLP